MTTVTTTRSVETRQRSQQSPAGRPYKATLDSDYTALTRLREQSQKLRQKSARILQESEELRDQTRQILFSIQSKLRKSPE